MLLQFVKAIVAHIFGLPEVKIIHRDTEVMRAILVENAELRRRLDLPLVSSIKCADGHMSRITHDLPVGQAAATANWVSQRN